MLIIIGTVTTIKRAHAAKQALKQLRHRKVLQLIKLNEQAQKDLGLKINLDGIDGLTILAPVTSSVRFGTGPDIICAINNRAQLYADSVR